MASVCQLLLISISCVILFVAIGRARFELADLVAPGVALLATAISWFGWVLHRAPTRRNVGLFIIWEICLYGVPFFCSGLFLISTAIAGQHVGIFLSALAAICLILIAGTARYRRPKIAGRPLKQSKKNPDDDFQLPP
jgi:hypothetical protein